MAATSTAATAGSVAVAGRVATAGSVHAADAGFAADEKATTTLALLPGCPHPRPATALLPAPQACLAARPAGGSCASSRDGHLAEPLRGNTQGTHVGLGHMHGNEAAVGNEMDDLGVTVLLRLAGYLDRTPPIRRERGIELDSPGR